MNYTYTWIYGEQAHYWLSDDPASAVQWLPETDRFRYDDEEYSRAEIAAMLDSGEVQEYSDDYAFMVIE